MTIDEAIKFCDEKSENIKLKAEPQVFIDIAEWLEELKKLRQNRNETPLATFTFNKAVMQKMVDEKVKEIELDIKAIRNQAIDDFTEALKQDVMAKTFGLRICDVDRISEQLKEGR